MTAANATSGRAAEVCRRYEVAKDAPPPGSCDIADYVEALVNEDFADEAVRFLANALPRRETIWWGCLCLWNVLEPTPPPTQDAVLNEIVQWVLEPGEPRRQAVVAVADSVEDTPLGYLAQAVTYSGETMSAPGLPVVPPPPFLAQRLVAGALRLAAAEHGGDNLLRHFLHWGNEIVGGKLSWSHA